MKLSDKQKRFTKDIAHLILYAESIGINLTFGETFRTKEQQEIYVSTGKSKTSNSQHLNRLAVDFNFFIDGELTYNKVKLEPLGKFWESIRPENEAGMFWKFLDVPHFQTK